MQSLFTFARSTEENGVQSTAVHEADLMAASRPTTASLSHSSKARVHPDTDARREMFQRQVNEIVECVYYPDGSTKSTVVKLFPLGRRTPLTYLCER
jgi:hypothetical protein